ncbi:hypothetical protein C8035_v000632 [Colletotrichum spinosum]|uniref:Uncharacterized protein n=1 Tax=Colletotrichum spinosum TaxID=1347390 RepID=A0A4V3HS18_9PEZI|nr:hypothetical protein C8035_v000632 [Colletotrichum spinosum]
MVAAGEPRPISPTSSGSSEGVGTQVVTQEESSTPAPPDNQAKQASPPKGIDSFFKRVTLPRRPSFKDLARRMKFPQRKTPSEAAQSEETQAGPSSEAPLRAPSSDVHRIGHPSEVSLTRTVAQGTPLRMVPETPVDVSPLGNVDDELQRVAASFSSQSLHRRGEQRDLRHPVDTASQHSLRYPVDTDSQRSLRRFFVRQTPLSLPHHASNTSMVSAHGSQHSHHSSIEVSTTA